MSDLTPIIVLRENVNDDSVCITKWLVAERSRVEKGQPIVEIETSKVNMEISAPASGFLRYVCREGQDTEIGNVLGYICDEVEADLPGTPHFVPSTADVRGDKQVISRIGLVHQPDFQSSRRKQQDEEVGTASEALPPTEAKERSTRFSEKALQLIKEWGFDASQFQGYGLVRSEDVLKRIREELVHKNEATSSKISKREAPGMAPVPAAGVKFRSEKLARSKRLEAKYLWSAYQNTLPSAVTIRCATDSLKAAAEKETWLRADVTALIIFEVARLLRKYAVFNAYYAAECAHYYDEINIGFAIDAGHGLMVPVIRNADTKSVAEIAKEMREFVVQYLSNELSVQSLVGGTFTVTDLSSEGVNSFHPLINQGQSAILAICSEFYSTASKQGMSNF